MKLNDIYPSNFLKAEDVKQGLIATIRFVQMEEIGQDKTEKPIAYFSEVLQGLVLNKTNWESIVLITGQDDSDNWPGHQVYLFQQMVSFQGKSMPGIRVQMVPQPAQPVQPAPLAPLAPLAPPAPPIAAPIQPAPAPPSLAPSEVESQ